MPSSFCAVCTRSSGPFVQRPLGKDDALVTVCHACDGDRPSQPRPVERGFEPSGGLIDRSASSKGARRAMGDERYERGATPKQTVYAHRGAK